MQKLIRSVLFLTMALAVNSFASPAYTLQSICEKYGVHNQCQSIPFCQATYFETGCYLAKGAPSYIEAMCKLQTMKQGCDIMAAQGNCAWVERSYSSCDATTDSL
ncbi:MAG: hypothetical protein JNL11_06380 [Bdellovibrionaceae bacterium]|nr:hypothetical protein [Pseudobdellovibrionaceae bacterium]